MAAEQYTKLTKENMFKTFLNDMSIEIKGDVAEIIDRPLYYRLMIIPFFLDDGNPFWLSVDVMKDAKMDEKFWNFFSKIEPFTSITLRAVQNHTYTTASRIFAVKDIICVNPYKTINYIQYCPCCDSFNFVNSPTDYRQCCAEESNSKRAITRTPLKTREKIRLRISLNNKITIKPSNSSKEFTINNLADTDYDSGYLCPICGTLHCTLLLQHDDGSKYRYCTETNKIQNIDIKERKKEEMIRKGDIIIPKDDKKDDAKAALDKAQDAINKAKKLNDSVGTLSDSYHTFNDLYHHRAMLFASLCITTFKNKAWKSLLHSDPNEPMYPGMFVVGVETPEGQATYHYNIDPYWAIFKVREVDRAPKYDGHTPEQAIERIYNYAVQFSVPVNRSITISSDPGQDCIAPIQYINEVDTTGTPIIKTGINVSTTKKDMHNRSVLE